MIAVIETGGKQYIVQKGDQILVDRIDTDKKTLSFSPLLVSDDVGKETKIGTPTLDDHKVECKVIGEERGDKIRVFKMKAKKRYARTKGFRAALTRLEISSIGVSTGEKKASSASTKKPVAKSAATKKAPAKKPAATKKPAAKKAPTKKAA